MRRLKEKSLKNTEHIGCPKRKRRRFADKQKLLQSTLIKVVPMETAEDDYNLEDLIISPDPISTHLMAPLTERMSKLFRFSIHCLRFRIFERRRKYSFVNFKHGGKTERNQFSF